jgi:D-lactate dehydrogenase (cytochrome)
MDDARLAPSWIDALAVPADRIDRDWARRALFAHDIFDAGQTPAAVIAPASVGEVQSVVAGAAAAGAPLTVRGGGASYTLGYAPARPGGVSLDLSSLNRIRAIDEASLTVTVEAGVTWAALDAALGARGLRAPFWGPYSGAVATIGGSLSQHAISLGTAAHGASADGVIALEVVDGQGRLLQTNRPDGAYLRAWGPDLTGLFLGDCGVLGVKTAATLKVMRKPTHVAACSFAFADFPALAAASRAVAGRGLASEILGLDPEIQKGFLGELTPRRFAATAKAIWATSAGPVAALGALARAAGGLSRMAQGQTWACHFTIDGWSAAEATAKVAAVRALCSPLGTETANAAPLALRGAPFLPLFPVLTLAGERWLPTHGVFAAGAVEGFHAAFEAWRASIAADMTARGVRITRMIVPVGPTAVVYEPTFYWPDSRTPAQEALAPAEHLARAASLPANEETRAAVFAWRKALTGLMQAHGAQHFQIGKWYPYASRLEPGAHALLKSLKQALDPAGILNPGALEL